MTLLPPIPGPKTKQFVTNGPTDLVFLQKLGGGADSTVYKVQINGQVYSLKVVCLFAALNGYLVLKCLLIKGYIIV